MSRKSIAIATGGTGGHVLPAQVFGDRVAQFTDVCYMGVDLEKNAYIRREGKLVFSVEGGNFSKGTFQGINKIYRGFSKSIKILKEQKVDHVIGFGSYHSLPVILSALYLKIPYSLVETNVLPGKVNSFLSRWAKRTLIHFDPAKKSLFGNVKLMNYDFTGKKIDISGQNARRHFGLDPEKKTLLVFGGSQGAEVINNCMREIAQHLPKDSQVIHFTGKETPLAEVYKSASILSYVKPFSHEMEMAWQAADLVICRAGAGALREMLLYEKGGILIPFPEAKDGHQKKNALFMQDIVKGALHLDQKDLNPKKLLEMIRDLLANGEEKLKRMQVELRTFKEKEERPDIISIIQEVL